MIVANAKLQIFGDLPKGLSPFLSAQFNFLSDTNNQIYSDNLNWKNYEIENFTVPSLSDKDISELNSIYKRYLEDIEQNANVRITTGSSSYNVGTFKEYKIVRSKHIIDEIDDYICPLYGLTEDETNFVKNYELIFRLAGE